MGNRVRECWRQSQSPSWARGSCCVLSPACRSWWSAAGDLHLLTSLRATLSSLGSESCSCQGKAFSPAVPELSFGTSPTEKIRLVLCPPRPGSLLKSDHEAADPTLSSADICSCMAGEALNVGDVVVLSQMPRSVEGAEEPSSLAPTRLSSRLFLSGPRLRPNFSSSNFHLKSLLKTSHCAGVN